MWSCQQLRRLRCINGAGGQRLARLHVDARAIDRLDRGQPVVVIKAEDDMGRGLFGPIVTLDARLAITAFSRSA